MMITKSYWINKIVNILLPALILIMIPLALHSQELPRITNLIQDQPAPYEGVLFNPLAVAQMKVNLGLAGEEGKLKYDYLLGKETAKHDLIVSNLQASIRIQKDMYETILKIDKKELAKMQELAIGSTQLSKLGWFSIGAGASATITLVIMWIVMSADGQ